MKKLLKLTAVITALVMMLSIIPVFADEGDVEISFKVGDSTLLINGTPVTVVTPYLVGDGTTLVPVRVITEAFGAKVDWDNDTQTAILEYEGTKINLQIGNIIAEVNGKAETLLAAPELTNGSTMVPLRFISESFNATVNYDHDTEAITVVKKANAHGTTVTGNENSKNVGDSYYGWTLEKPADMQMDYRSFDGSYVSFMYDEDNYIYIDIIAADPEYNLDEDFEEAKKSISDSKLTLIKAEKKSDTNLKQIYIQAKNQLYFHDTIRYVNDKYSILIYGKFENEDAEKRDRWIETIKTFKPNFDGIDTFDLSNVKNGTRTYEAKDINLTFEVPQEFYVSSSDYAINEFDFYSILSDDNISSMQVNVYSKSDVGSAKKLAEYDYNFNYGSYNTGVVKFCESVYEKQYDNFSAYEYTFEYSMKKDKAYFRDVFFELDDYVYNVTLSLSSRYDNVNEYADKIINSVKAKPIDASKVGILLRNIKDIEGTYKSEIGDFELTIPKTYEEEVYGSTGMYIHGANGTVLTCTLEKYANVEFADAKKYLQSIVADFKQEEEISIMQNTSEVDINGVKYAKAIIKESTEKGYSYYHVYVGVKNTSLFSIAIIFPEIAYSDKLITEAENIIKSIK